ncbi:MAG: transposase [Candidatus Aureabacteria bacterium]|nr:transposase [Candidatus Auribacterota bacterium]
MKKRFLFINIQGEHWRRIKTNNPLERLMREIRRRTRVVGNFSDGKSALMLACSTFKKRKSVYGRNCRLTGADPHGVVGGKHRPLTQLRIIQMCERLLTLPSKLKQYLSLFFLVFLIN